MRTTTVTAIAAALAIATAACGGGKEQQRQRQLTDEELSLVGSWITEGTMEQISDNLTAGYAQCLEFRDDGTFSMGVAVSLSGSAPSYSTTTIPVSATFGADIGGTYTLAGDTLTLAYDASTINAHIDEDDISVELGEYAGAVDADALKAQLIAMLNAAGMTEDALTESLRASVGAASKDTFTGVKASGSTLTMDSDGETATYYRD